MSSEPYTNRRTQVNTMTTKLDDGQRAYASRMVGPKPPYPHGAALNTIRGSLSMEQAAVKVGVTRSSWDGWERLGVWPRESALKRIVEEFRCPPEMVGYEPPKGWELVPSKWIRDKFDEIIDLLEHGN
jgi:hypothetical protein